MNKPLQLCRYLEEPCSRGNRSVFRREDQLSGAWSSYLLFLFSCVSVRLWSLGGRVGGWLWKLGSHPLANLNMCLTSVEHWGWSLRKPVWDMMLDVKENCSPLPNLTCLEQSTVAFPAPGPLLCILLGYVGGVVISVFKSWKNLYKILNFFFLISCLLLLPQSSLYFKD